MLAFLYLLIFTDLQFTLSRERSQSCLSALPYQVALEFSQCAKDMKDKPATAGYDL